MSQAAAGLYLHIPFCRAKCHYCDFNTYAGIEELIPRYVTALAQEIAQAAATLDRQGRHLVSCFLGGGTPSLLTAAQVARLLTAAADHWGLPTTAEVTLEANPGTVTPASLAELHAAGVNRLSFGVQSLQPAGLIALGRQHAVEDVLVGVQAARQAGLTNLSLDLIYGWPGQRPADWQADLATVIALEVPHLSLYPLTVESGTPLATMVRSGRLRVADDDLMATLYEMAVERLAAANYVHYEVANWALTVPGQPPCGKGATPPLASRHNLLYWRNEEYWGGGPGAHSHWQGQRWMNLRSPRQYIERVLAGGELIAQTETIDAQLAMAETMMLGLRLAEGVDDADFARRHGRSLMDAFGALLTDLAAQGLVEWCGQSLIVPANQRFLLDGIVLRFLPEPAVADASDPPRP